MQGIGVSQFYSLKQRLYNSGPILFGPRGW